MGLGELAHTPETGTVPSRLVEQTDLPPTAGNLRMLTYVPADLPRRAPLVVVLHGCTQTAAAYDHGAGWSALADRHGFALLYPEQRRANHPFGCFGWYQPHDQARDYGEAQSIRQMIGHLVAAHRFDTRQVYFTGLSAVGAMTSVMLVG
jgi:feruloyl esterase